MKPAPSFLPAVSGDPERVAGNQILQPGLQLCGAFFGEKVYRLYIDEERLLDAAPVAPFIPRQFQKRRETSSYAGTEEVMVLSQLRMRTEVRIRRRPFRPRRFS